MVAALPRVGRSTRLMSKYLQSRCAIWRQDDLAEWKHIAGSIPCAISRTNAAIQADMRNTKAETRQYQVVLAQTAYEPMLGDRLYVTSHGLNLRGLVVSDLTVWIDRKYQAVMAVEEDSAAEAVQVTFMRWDQTEQEDVTVGPYAARLVWDSGEQERTSEASAATRIGGVLFIDGSPLIEVGDRITGIPRAMGAVVTRVRTGPAGMVEASFSADAGVA